MAESQKGTSATADSKKQSSSLDFGKDFLSSWKSGKMGKDAIDFDMETAPRNKKTTFNFDKLDDFELGGDFDKLSSFKMDMPDLDFSSPLKKTEKPKGKSCDEIVQGKKEPKQDKFSFTFDFNELDRFDLDSNLLKGEKKSSKCTDNSGPDHSIKHDKDQESIKQDTNQESRINSATSTDVFEDDENNEIKRFPISESMDISRSEHLIDPNIVNRAGPSTSSDYGHQDLSHEAVTSTEKKMIEVEENKNETRSRERNKQHSDGTCFMKPYAEKAKQEFFLQSVSGDSSAQEALPQFGTGLPSLDPVKANSARELDDSARSIDSSHSRNSSPANSYNSRCWWGTSITESPNNIGETQKRQGNQNGVTGVSTVLNESTKGQKDVEDASATNFSQKNACLLKYTGDKQSSSSKLLPSPLLRGSILVKSMSVKENTATALQLKPLSKSVDTVSQSPSAPTPKQLYSVDSGKIKTINICPAIENRQSKQNDKTDVENQKGCILKSYDKSSAKGVTIITGGEKNDNRDICRVQLPPSNLPGQTTAISTAKSNLPNLVSGIAPIKSSQKSSVERQGISVKDEKICDISSSKVSGITKLNIKTSNSTMQKETKSVRFSERNLEFPLNTGSKVFSSVTTQKYALSSPPLKRKTPEESKPDPESLNPLKRLMESTTERRRSLGISLKVDMEVVPGTGNPEACQGNVSIDNLASSNSIPEVGSVAAFEVPILIENDGNVEKAEACAKELDDICSMLKKKHEEAKELLVRAIVNNNTLLMLNHPMYDEKIRVLQRFASILQSKEF